MTPRKRAKKTGLLPGTLVHVGEQKIDKTKITIIDYDETQFQEMEIDNVEAWPALKDMPIVTWVNIDGIHDVEVIEKIGERFGLHPLLLEDILNTEQRPKMEDYGGYIFVVLKTLSYDEERREVKTDQISLILGRNYVISFQEQEEGVFGYVRDRIRDNKGRIRNMGPTTFSILWSMLLLTIISMSLKSLEKP